MLNAPVHATAAKKLTRRASAVSVLFNLASTIIKVVGAVLTGSVSLFSEAVHSATDVVASLGAFFSVRVAALPPDDEHPYGHGKVESLAGFGESVLLLGIVGYIFYEAIVRLTTHHAPVQKVDIGLLIMALSAAGSFIAGLYVQKTAKETRSTALASNGQHLMVDCVTSLGVLLALLITKFTGWVHADAAVALLFGAWLAWGAWRMLKRAFHELIDRRLPDDEIAKIRAIISAQEGIISFHRLRTRLSGQTRWIDFHVVVPRDCSVVESHEMVDILEKRLRKEMAPAQTVVHVDPYDPAKANQPRLDI